MTLVASHATVPFDGLTVGNEMISHGCVITQKMVDQFAELSGDRNPIHIDHVFASSTGYGGPIAHGALVLSVATGLAAQLGISKLTVVFRSFDDWEFKRPVRPGDSIHVRLRLEEKTRLERAKATQAKIRAEIRNQNEKIVQCGTWTIQIFD